MAKITIRWREFPNCPEATNYDKSRSEVFTFLGIIANLSLLILIMCFFQEIFNFFFDYDWLCFFVAFFYLLIAGVIAHLMYVVYPNFTERGLQFIFQKYSDTCFSENKYKQEKRQIKKLFREKLRESTKYYYFWFLSIIVFIVIGLTFIFSIILLVSGDDGVGLLIFSIFAGVASAFGFNFLKDIVYGSYIPLKTKFTSYKKSNKIRTPVANTNTHVQYGVYCTQCGQKLSTTHMFCHACGAPVKKNDQTK